MRRSLIALAAAAALMSCRGEAASDQAGGRPAAPDDFELTASISVRPLNTGARGMIGQIEWAYSPDSSALIAVEDWASVEAEPFFDAFVIASEKFGTVNGQDSVWDAQPSPDWHKVAYGAALVVHAGESETLPPSVIAGAAQRLGVSPEEARASQFVASGMAAAAGFSKLGVMDVATGDSHLLSSLTGWQVRWNSDGTRVFGGLGPAIANDAAPSRTWVAMTVSGDSAVQYSGDSSMDTATVIWIAGPTLDLSVTPDSTPVTLVRVGHMVSSNRDTIRVDDKIVGEGIVLAATRHGCFVLALVKDPAAGEFDPQWRGAMIDAGCRR